MVIAVMALLAALLLPALSKGKATARSTACKSNLREIGIALNLYVQAFHQYPPSVLIVSTWSPQRQTWGISDFSSLLPYVGDASSVFNCPEAKATNLSTYDQLIVGFGDYGYNGFGTGFQKQLALGLGAVNQTPISESGVKVPTDMVAIGDSTSASAIEPFTNVMDQVSSRHNNGANIVFCDGHIEYGKMGWWSKASESARLRWNNDHQPHRETWVVAAP